MPTEILNQVLGIILPALATLLATWFAVLGNKMKNTYEQRINTQVKQDVVNATVQYVQQVYVALEGPEKLQKAIEQASAILQEKGIKVSEVELNMLIESSVYGLKQGLTEQPVEYIEAEVLTTEEAE